MKSGKNEYISIEIFGNLSKKHHKVKKYFKIDGDMLLWSNLLPLLLV